MKVKHILKASKKCSIDLLKQIVLDATTHKNNVLVISKEYLVDDESKIAAEIEALNELRTMSIAQSMTFSEIKKWVIDLAFLCDQKFGSEEAEIQFTIDKHSDDGFEYMVIDILSGGLDMSCVTVTVSIRDTSFYPPVKKIEREDLIECHVKTKSDSIILLGLLINAFNNYDALFQYNHSA